MVIDYVECCNCNFVGTVETGQEFCPCCKKVGVLKWVDEDNQEMEI